MDTLEFNKTFGATFGIKSKAGDIALEMLTDDEKTHFCRMCQTFYHHLSRCYSEIVCKLLLDNFTKNIDNGKWKNDKHNSYKKNALKTMFRERVKYIERYESKLIKREYWD
jgi:phage tail tube protein FII